MIDTSPSDRGGWQFITALLFRHVIMKLAICWRSAMPSVMAKKLYPDLLILPHRMEAYREAQVQMRRIFYDYTELVEPLSLDEAFLDVTYSEYFQGSAHESLIRFISVYLKNCD